MVSKVITVYGQPYGFQGQSYGSRSTIWFKVNCLILGQPWAQPSLFYSRNNNFEVSNHPKICMKTEHQENLLLHFHINYVF